MFTNTSQNNHRTNQLPAFSFTNSVSSYKIRGQIHLDQFIENIRGGKHRSVIDDYRNKLDTGYFKTNEERQEFKAKTLPCYYPAVQLKHAIKIDDVKEECSRLSGLMHFDVDNIRSDDYSHIKTYIINNLDPVYLVKSPSGGIKFAVFADLKPTEYQRYKPSYKILLERFNAILNSVNVELDSSPCAINSGMYATYDPAAHYNPNAKTHSVRKYAIKQESDEKQEQERLRKEQAILRKKLKILNGAEQDNADQRKQKYVDACINTYTAIPPGIGQRNAGFFNLGVSLKKCGLTDHEIESYLSGADYDRSRGPNGVRGVMASLSKASVQLIDFTKNYKPENPASPRIITFSLFE